MECRFAVLRVDVPAMSELRAALLRDRENPSTAEPAVGLGRNELCDHSQGKFLDHPKSVVW